LPYEILTGRVKPWNYAPAATGRYLNVAPRLREAMTANAHLRIFVANGYYDLATPYFATEHTFQHLGGDRALIQRVTMKHYEAGNMMYIHPPSLRKLKEDIGRFLRQINREQATEASGREGPPLDPFGVRRIARTLNGFQRTSQVNRAQVDLNPSKIDRHR